MRNGKWDEHFLLMFCIWRAIFCVCSEEQQQLSANNVENHKFGTHTIWFASCLIPFLHMQCTFGRRIGSYKWLVTTKCFILKYIIYTLSYCITLLQSTASIGIKLCCAHVSKRNEFVTKLCTRTLSIHKKGENLFDLISSFPNCIFAIWLRLCIRKYAKRLSFFFPCLFLSISVSSLFRVLLKFTTSFIWTTSCDILLQFLEKLSIYMNACSNFVIVVKHWKALLHAHMSSTHH